MGSPTAPGISTNGNVLGIQGVSGGLPLTVQPTGTFAVSGSINATTTFPFAGNSDAQAAGAAQATGLMGFNGLTWDRLRVDIVKNLQVSLNSGATPLGAATTAGTAASGAILTIQGNASGVPIPVTTSTPVSGYGTSATNPLFVTTGLNATNIIRTLYTTATGTASGGGTFTMGSSAVTGGKIGSLQQIVFSCPLQGQCDMQIVNTSGVATTFGTLLTTGSIGTVIYQPPIPGSFQTVSADGVNAKFQVVYTNLDTGTIGNCFVTFVWTEN